MNQPKFPDFWVEWKAPLVCEYSRLSSLLAARVSPSLVLSRPRRFRMWRHLSSLSGKFTIALGSKPPLVTRIARTGLGTRLSLSRETSQAARSEKKWLYLHANKLCVRKKHNSNNRIISSGVIVFFFGCFYVSLSPFSFFPFFTPSVLHFAPLSIIIAANYNMLISQPLLLPGDIMVRIFSPAGHRHIWKREYPGAKLGDCQFHIFSSTMHLVCPKNFA